ncbi:MAG: hypothetical protein QOG53_1758 [Frankiales bacterium]|jgi:uncharacterized membrane protein YphA (DoxX/SURF4 family)|nr:hypothetical protein [Frankiales bacterium]
MSLIRRAARPLLAVTFIANGIEKLREPGPHIQRARDAGLDQRLPVDAATLTRGGAAVQLGAGVMLATNRLPRLSALALAASLVPETYAEAPFWSETDKQARGQQRRDFVTKLGLLGGLMIAAVDTGGRESLPHKVSRTTRKTARKAEKKAKKAAQRVG